MAKKIIITIDGWSSCGKSTLPNSWPRSWDIFMSIVVPCTARLHFIFSEINIDWTNKKEVKQALKSINLEFVHNESSESSEIFLNGENVEYVIRDLVIAEKVSDVAAIKEVREFAVAQQKKMGAKKGIIMDGRDIGTVVFPKAELKIFMTADNAIRVQRRFKEII